MVLDQAVAVVRSLVAHDWRTVFMTGNCIFDPVDTAPVIAALGEDSAAVPPSIREYIRFPPFAPDHLANSLTDLAELAGTRPVDQRGRLPGT